VTGLTQEAVPPRRLALWALVAGLCIAALVAIVALVSGSFDDTDWRIIATSLGFSVCSATAAAGEALRRERGGARALVAGVTVAASAAAWLLLLAGLWIYEDSEGLWRACGCFALLALAGSHASLVLRSMRPADSDAVRALCWTSVATGAIDSTAGVLGISGVIEGVDEGVVTVLAVLLVILLLTTALPPILRRIAGPQRPPMSRDERVAERLEAIAGRLDGPDAEELRQLATSLRSTR
jgi:hypothetical protein